MSTIVVDFGESDHLNLAGSPGFLSGYLELSEYLRVGSLREHHRLIIQFYRAS